MKVTLHSCDKITTFYSIGCGEAFKWNGACYIKFSGSREAPYNAVKFHHDSTTRHTTLATIEHTAAVIPLAITEVVFNEV